MMFSTLRRRKKGRSNRFALFLMSFVVTVVLFLYLLNDRLMPTYLYYAEVQTYKIASHDVSKANHARTTSVLDVNEIIEALPTESDYMSTTKFNTESIKQVRA